MGAYYGIGNVTKKTVVSDQGSRWKNNPECDRHEVMHRYHWEITDHIYSCGGCSFYVFVHNELNNTMEPVEINKNYQTVNMDSKNTIKVGFYTKYNEVIKTVTHPTDLSNVSQDVINQIFGGGNLTLPSRNVAVKINDSDITDHAPIWEGNQCIICNYEHNPKDITHDKKEFRTGFFMN